MKLLGLAGRMGSGKSTIASYIKKLAPDRVYCASFAQPVKAIGCIIGGGCVGATINKRELVPTLADIGITWRRLYQIIGTEFGRNMLSPDIWVRIAQFELDQLRSGPELVIYDDVRFENEVHFIKNQGGKVYHVVRDDLPLFPESTHPSEQLPDPHLFDGVIYNNEDLSELHEKAVLLAMEFGLFVNPDS